MGCIKCHKRYILNYSLILHVKYQLRYFRVHKALDASQYLLYIYLSGQLLRLIARSLTFTLVLLGCLSNTLQKYRTSLKNNNNLDSVLIVLAKKCVYL